MNIKVPSVGESITSGILGAWKVEDGGYVKSGDTVLEIETDKVTSEVYAEASGAVKQLAKEGEEVQVGQVIGEIDESAKAPSGTQEGKKAAEKSEDKDQKSEDKKQQAAAPETSVGRDDSPSRPSEQPKTTTHQEDPHLSGEATAKTEQGTESLSPAVRRLLEEHNLDPADIHGSGKDGRILKADVLNYIESGQPSAVSSQPTEPVIARSEATRQSTTSPAPTASGDRVTITKMSPLRQKIANRLVAAQHSAAMLTTFNEADLTAVMALRKRHQDAFVKKHGVKLGFMSLFTKAVIYALKAVPSINARIDGDSIIQNHYFDIGIAMSTERGLLVPVVRDCDQLTLAGIEKEIIAYGQKAKEGKIQVADMEGGVFTITNGGIFGSMLSTPILNPPQSGILGMHSIQERPVAINGQVVIRPMMYLALTYDHRIVDGKEAVTFLVKAKEWLEQPGVELLDL
jgi:2-oxoglutarate dehydrogenase E2 component (dihydrolipoamide succinyltransferase)